MSHVKIQNEIISDLNHVNLEIMCMRNGQKIAF